MVTQVIVLPSALISGGQPSTWKHPFDWFQGSVPDQMTVLSVIRLPLAGPATFSLRTVPVTVPDAWWEVASARARSPSIQVRADVPTGTPAIDSPTTVASLAVESFAVQSCSSRPVATEKTFTSCQFWGLSAAETSGMPATASSRPDSDN